MLIESRQRLQTFNTPPSLLIDNAPKKGASTKSLGVYVDENLSWNVHVDKIACFWYWYLEEKWAFCYI